MRLPWFMHMHTGIGNTGFGVFPTPVGTFARSCIDGRMEVVWYPMGHEFPGGDSRVVTRLATVDTGHDGEVEIENAVVDFMHSHPVLALTCSFDQVSTHDLEWNVVGEGALATLETPYGLVFQIHHGGNVTVEFLPAGSQTRETIGVFADTCDEYTLKKRVDARVRRRLIHAEAGTTPPRRTA